MVRGNNDRDLPRSAYCASMSWHALELGRSGASRRVKVSVLLEGRGTGSSEEGTIDISLPEVNL